MYLVEARRAGRDGRPAAIARFIVTAGSTFAALSKLRFYYDTSVVDSVTAEEIHGAVPISGALVHDMTRRAPVSEGDFGGLGGNDWERGAA